jgi:CHASE3 domain sensor protein
MTMFSSSKRRIAAFSVVITLLLGSLGYVLTTATVSSQIATSATVASQATASKAANPTVSARTHRATRSSSAS